MCQKTNPSDTSQTTDRADQKNNDDPRGSDVLHNSDVQMGYINQVVSMEMDNDVKYTRPHRPFGGYETSL